MYKPTCSLLALAVLLLAGGAARADLINGDFEGFGEPAGMVHDHNDASINAAVGWLTTEADHQIEVWGSGFNGVPVFSGVDFVELNANAVGTLYQDVSGIPAGAIIGFQFAHRGRLGVDTMLFQITDMTTNQVLYSQTVSDGNTAWGFYTGTGIVATGDTLRFSYDSISAAGDNPTFGNFLDDAAFGVGVGMTTPEPASALLLLTGAAGVCGYGAWRKRRIGLAK